MLHFTPRHQWEAAAGGPEYRPAAMEEDGFVHLSYGHQLARAAAQWAPGALDLVLLVVDPAGLEADLKLEGGFPHLYRPVPLASVRMVVDLPLESDGTFAVPEPARLAELALTARPSAAAALARARSVLTGFDRPWWLAGGWATDALNDPPSRPHLDLDVAVLRRDMAAVGRHLADWDLRLARSGQLSAWDRQPLPPSDHQVWGRPGDGFRPERWQDFAADPGFVEFLAEELDDDGETWVYRRDPVLRAPLSRLGRPGGFLAIEVALLYKAPAAAGDDPVVAAKSQSDFDRALGHLQADQRRWLTDAVGAVQPGHPWLERLSA